MTGRWWARAVASVGGIGHVGWAPGTAGSVAALGAGLVLRRWSGWCLPVAAGLSVPLGWSAVRRAGAAAGDDAGWVVVDEVSGQLIALLGAGRTGGWRAALAALALFRLFDIGKPGPVGWADKRTGAWWVMADDVMAGAMAACCLLAARRLAGVGR